MALHMGNFNTPHTPSSHQHPSTCYTCAPPCSPQDHFVLTLSVSNSQMPGMLSWLFMASVDALTITRYQHSPSPLRLMLQIISLLHALRVMAASHLVCLLQPNAGDAPAAFLASADALITHHRCSFPSLHHHHPRPPAAANTSCHCTPQAYSICLLQPDAWDDFVAVATNAQTLPLLSPSPSHRASCYTYHFFLNAPLRPTLSVSCSQMHGMLLWLFMASVDALIISNTSTAPTHPFLAKAMGTIPTACAQAQVCLSPYLSPATRYQGCFRGSSWPVLTP